MLQAEGCFRYLSVTFHSVRQRLGNHSPEIWKSFGWDWKIVWRRTFYGSLQWKETERWVSYLSFHNILCER